MLDVQTVQYNNMYLYNCIAILRRITRTPHRRCEGLFSITVTSVVHRVGRFALHTIILILRCRSDFYVETPIGIILYKVFYLIASSFTDQTKSVTL